MFRLEVNKSLKKELKNLIFPVFLIILGLFLIYKYELNSNLAKSAILLLIGYSILEYAIGDIIPKLLNLFGKEQWKTTQRKLEREGKLQENSTIRISFAYLFRIKIDGKYFLVPNTRTGKYQPVGGAYKFNEEEARYLSKNIPVENDDCIPVDEITKRDYRLLVKNKDLRKFVKRFNKTANRENINDLSREFVEEIFGSGILNRDEFGNLTYRYCGRHITDIGETVFRPFEILLADIVEVILTDAQKEIFRKLIKIDSEKYKFCSANEIKSLGVKVGTQELGDCIANHTYKILSENTDKLSWKNKYTEPFTIIL